MPSTFPALDITKPDQTQAGTAFAQSSRDMLTFLRASLVSGTLVGYSMAISGGTTTYPTTIVYSKGVEQVRQSITWGTVGGALNNPQTIKYEYSSDSGSTWANMGSTNGLLTYTFNSDGTVASSAWS